MKLSKKLIIVISILVLGVFFDQWTKSLALSSLKGHETMSYLGGLFKLIYAENTGAWGNLGGDWPPILKSAFLLYIPVIVLLGLGIFTITSKVLKSIEIYSYALILSGGIGNIIDRFRDGFVIDFMWMGFPKLGTNIFNIADVLIMVGFGLLLLQWFKERKNGTSK